MSKLTTERLVLTSAATATQASEVTTHMPMVGMNAVALQLSGTFTATVTFEATVNGTNWITMGMTPISGGSVATTGTAAGIWYSAVKGLAAVRGRITTYTDGPVTVTAIASA